jgi:hypothetical protein
MIASPFKGDNVWVHLPSREITYDCISLTNSLDNSVFVLILTTTVIIILIWQPLSHHLWDSRLYTVIYWTRSQNDVFHQKYNAKSIQKLNYLTSLLTRCNHTLSPLKGDALIRYLPWREMQSYVIFSINVQKGKYDEKRAWELTPVTGSKLQETQSCDGDVSKF